MIPERQLAVVVGFLWVVGFGGLGAASYKQNFEEPSWISWVLAGVSLFLLGLGMYFMAHLIKTRLRREESV